MSDDFFERHPHAAAPDAPPAHWPKGVRIMSIDGMDKFGVDAQGRLYVDGKRIATVNEFRLSKAQAWVAGTTAVLASLATVSTAVFDAIRFFTQTPPTP